MKTNCFVQIEEAKIELEKRDKETAVMREELVQLNNVLQKQQETVVLTERALADADQVSRSSETSLIAQLRRDLALKSKELESTRAHADAIEEETQRWAQEV